MRVIPNCQKLYLSPELILTTTGGAIHDAIASSISNQNIATVSIQFRKTDHRIRLIERSEKMTTLDLRSHTFLSQVAAPEDTITVRKKEAFRKLTKILNGAFSTISDDALCELSISFNRGKPVRAELTQEFIYGSK